MPPVSTACLQTWLWLEGWRWCFFSAGFIPIYYISEAFVHVAELLVEKQLFTVQQALYFAVSIHVSRNTGCTFSRSRRCALLSTCAEQLRDTPSSLCMLCSWFALSRWRLRTLGCL